MGDWAVVPASDWSVVREPVDMGPEARRRSDVSRGMRPEMPPDDDVSVASDYAKHDVRKTLQGVNDQITTPEASEAQKARSQAEDPIRNDPLAGMIVQGIPAAGLGVVAGGLTRYVAPGLAPLVQGATTGAASSPDNPLLGAALGAIPGAKQAAGAADSAIGKAALGNVRPVGSPPGLGARVIAKSLGAAVGGSTHGPLGLLVGHSYGGKIAPALSSAADNVTNALAERYLNQQADATLAGRGLVHFGDVPAPPVGSPTSAPMVNLSPLAHQPLPEATMVPNGALGTPFVDDFGVPVTKAGLGGSVPGEAATNAGGKVLPPSLRDDVVRSSKAFRDDPYDTDAPATPDIEDQLARSVRMFGQLKSAKAAGKLTPADIQDAVKAGMSPIAVAKVVGQDAFDSAMGK